MSEARPRIHVGPEQVDPRVAIKGVIEDAVMEGGGELSAPDEADAVVWLAGEPSQLEPILHSGIRWVQIHSAAVHHWVESGVLGDRVVTCGKGLYGETVGEHVLALILAAARSLDRAARARQWTPLPGRLVKGSTVMVVGTGGIGGEVIDMLQCLGGRVTAVNRRGHPIESAAETLPIERIMDRVGEVDYLVLTLPETPLTRGLVDETLLRAMKATAWVVNVSTGRIIDTPALTKALSGGSIGGAALDVTEPQPLPADHPLWSSDRCLITSHSANPVEGRSALLAGRVRSNVSRFAAGAVLEGLVDWDAGY